jgi:hypothetical protein
MPSGHLVNATVETSDEDDLAAADLLSVAAAVEVSRAVEDVKCRNLGKKSATQGPPVGEAVSEVVDG